MTDQRTTSATLYVDADRSTVGWSVKHLGVSTIHGTFRTFEGVLRDGEASGTVAAAAVHTDDEARDRFVRSDEFLDADSYPLMRFRARMASGDETELDGELTIRDTTLPLSLEVTGVDHTGDGGMTLHLRGTVRRRAYGLRFHQAMGAADRSVGDEVEVTLDLALAPRD